MAAPLFDNQSPFILRDNRIHRPMLTTTADLFNRRHEALMPPGVVEGLSVLDIGCAIAATGKWVLDRGAVSYVGVEPQQEYADTAAELLAPFPGAQIVCERGVEYLAACDAKYDVVSLIGVLHGQYDLLGFLDAACAVADQYMCLEMHGNESSGAVLTPVSQAWMPLAGQNGSSTGFGWAVAPSALSILMGYLGFEPDMKPVYVDEQQSYRYTARYKRVGQRGKTAGDFANVVHWQSAPFSSTQPSGNPIGKAVNNSGENFERDELLALARLDMEQGRLEQGLTKLKTLLTGDCPSLEAVGMAARLYARLGLFERAEALFERYLEVIPTAIDEAFQLGMVRLDRGQEMRALEVWEKILQNQPTFTPALFFSAMVLSRHGKTADARRNLDVLLQTAPADNMYYDRARELLQTLR